MIDRDDHLDWQPQEHNKIMIYALVTMTQKLSVNASFSNSTLDSPNEVVTFIILATI